MFVIVQPGSQGASPSELLSTPSFLLVAAAVSQLCLLAAVWWLPRLFRDVGAHGWFERVRFPQKSDDVHVRTTLIRLA